MKKPAFFSRSILADALWGFRREFFVVGIFSFVANLLMVVPTLYMLQVFDRVMISQSELTLISLTIIAFVLFGIMGFAEWVRSWLLVRLSVRFDEYLSAGVFFATFESVLRRTGAPVQSFGDLTAIRQFLTGPAVFAFFDAPWTFVYIGVLFILHPALGGAAIVFCLLLAAVAWGNHRFTHAPLEAALESGALAMGFAHAQSRHAEIVESLGMVDNLRRRWQAKHGRAMAQNHRAQDQSHRVQEISKLIRYSQQSLIIAISSLLVIDGRLTPGAMVAANLLMSRTLAPIDMMVNTWRNFIAARVSFLRLETLLDGYSPKLPGDGQVPLQAQLTVCDLTATAARRPKPILKHLNVTFNPGEVVVMVGPSGSGKSTFARCLVGIWPEKEGAVLFDGREIGAWDRELLGPRIGYLPQEIELFEGSIAENIARFGKVDPDQVVRAAQRAGIHDMVLRHPKGYDTQIGEAGHLLSAGQRQRIGLARAMYGDPLLVVLDEPNAHLDDAGEGCLIRAIRELKAEGKLVVMVSHRSNATAVADRILKLEGGLLVAEFRRQELAVAS